MSQYGKDFNPKRRNSDRFGQVLKKRRFIVNEIHVPVRHCLESTSYKI